MIALAAPVTQVAASAPLTRALDAVSVIPTPHISYAAISPMLVVFGLALVGVLVEAFVPAEVRRPAQVLFALIGYVAAFVLVLVLHSRRELVASGAIAVDGPALFLQGMILIFAFLSTFLMAETRLDTAGSPFVASAAVVPGQAGAAELLRSRLGHTEIYPLTAFAVGGMMMFASSTNLLTMFVALEVLSLPLYVMCGLARRRRLLSQEAAVKYFLLGAFSSAFFVYGIALIYGYAGSVDLGRIADAAGLANHSDVLLFLGLGLLSVGLLFKVSAAPFHNWTPDVYQGAPTAVTAFMAAGTKVAAFGALLRVFYVSFGQLGWDWRPVMWGVAILTMVVGSVLAITQTDVKRMLAYSAIAHGGFILVGVVATTRSGVSGSLFYLLAYGFSTIGAFAIVTLVRDADGEALHLSRWRGLARTSPVVAGTFALFLLAFAGIPLTSGFVGKFAVFQAGWQGHAAWLVVVGVVASAVAAFFYLRVVVLMFFQEPAPDSPVVARGAYATYVAVTIGAIMTLLLGIYPQWALDLADKASVFVR